MRPEPRSDHNAVQIDWLAVLAVSAASAHRTEKPVLCENPDATSVFSGQGDATSKGEIKMRYEGNDNYDGNPVRSGFIQNGNVEVTIPNSSILPKSFDTFGHITAIIALLRTYSKRNGQGVQI